MAQQQTLTIERRERGGTTVARKLRHEGMVPAVLYGHGVNPELLAISQKAITDLVTHGGRTTLIELRLDGKRFDTALVRELQHDPVTRRIIHADLQRVSANEAVRASLPIATSGTARGVKDFGGVLDVLIHELEVEGPANKLPDRIDVDVTALGLHEHVTAGEIELPKGFTLLSNPEAIVVSVESSKVAKALEEAEAGAALEQAEPERVGEAAPAEGETQ
ncbi:MAG: 50S ribosomal protein L25 [Candidatus Eremiobacteraeota bacterium]|nr:50S ribosomal protein L25 [Candidatus Eremiobacteraeota bacterium]